jgi:DNA-binding MarR family transcriptional regulator
MNSTAADLDPGTVTPAGEVADTVVSLMRSFQRAKARYLALAQHDVEWSAQLILRQLATNGPMRSSAIADCLQSDPSTVSRQVSTMVKDGLLERRSDPEDGRASILALTEKADAVIAEHERLRHTHFEDLLADWSERDLSRFATLLRRFTADLDRSSARHIPGATPPAERTSR